MTVSKIVCPLLEQTVTWPLGILYRIPKLKTIPNRHASHCSGIMTEFQPPVE